MRMFLIIILLSQCLFAQKHVQIAETFVGVREKTGRNDGKEVEMFLKSVGLSKGYPYCAAFVSYCLTQANVKKPVVRSAMARNFETRESIKAKDVLIGKNKVPPGSIIVWRKGSTVNGHAGFAVNWSGVKGNTIEANTSSGEKGSQSDGDGVFKRTRTIEPGNYFRITSFLPVTY